MNWFLFPNLYLTIAWAMLGFTGALPKCGKLKFGFKKEKEVI